MNFLVKGHLFFKGCIVDISPEKRKENHTLHSSFESLFLRHNDPKTDFARFFQ